MRIMYGIQDGAQMRILELIFLFGKSAGIPAEFIHQVNLDRIGSLPDDKA